MLLEFRLENHRSFAGEHTLRLTSSPDKSLPSHLLAVEGQPKLRALKSTVIYGANGSGKSALVSAAVLMRQLVLTSATQFQADQPLPIEPFRLDPAMRDKPSSFEMTFVHDAVRYEYGFAATTRRIHDEWLFAYPQGRRQLWFERGDDIPDGWRFGPSFVGEKAQISRLTRPNALFLSTAANMNHEQATTVFRWFRDKLGHLTPSIRLPSELGQLIRNTPIPTVQMVELSSAMKEAVSKLLRVADVGIQDFAIDSKPIDTSRLPPELASQFEGRSAKHIRTRHVATDGSEIWFDLEKDESLGTRELLDVAGPWIALIREGLTIFVDEALSALHPSLVRFLLQLVHESKQGQVVMASHDTQLLDPRLLRRDQVYFVEKDPQGRSHLYSMLEYKPRKGEALEKGYLAGRYGALPFLGDFDFK